VPHALQAIAARCLAPRPADRYPDAAALAEDLDRFLQRRPLRYATNPSRLEPLANAVRRHAASLTLGAIAATAVTLLVYLNREHVLSPPEQWSELRRAVAKLDQNDAADALPSLAALGHEKPDSPVIAFYEAVAQGRLGHGAEAADALHRAWTQPDSAQKLLAWAATHPKMARDAAQAALKATEVVLPVAQRDPKQRDRQYRSVERTMELAVKLEPSLESARVGLSVFREDRGEYPEACDLLGGVIDATRARLDRDPSARAALFGWLQMRARARTHWAHALSDAPTGRPEAVAQARGLYHKALADIDAYKQLAANLPPTAPQFFQVNYIRGSILLALGELDEREGRSQEADDHYREADAMFALVAPYARSFQNDAEFNDLQSRARAKLRPRTPDAAPGAAD
jgi:hypothetical protein